MKSESRAERPRVLLTVATSILAIGAVVGIYFAAANGNRRLDPEEAPGEAGQALVEGNDYRVLVAVVRVKPLDPENDAWDSGAKSTRAPDPYCEIWWRDNLVYESEEVKDVLVASWSNLALPKLYELLTDATLSFESIKEGALVTAHRDETLRIRIRDKDPFKDDLIEEFEISLDELRIGDQILQGTQGLESLTLRVIPRDSNEFAQLLR